MTHLFATNKTRMDLGLTVLRIGIGCLFVLHGYPKILGGSEKWLWLGSQMIHVGISFAPVFWGFCAAISEFVGGCALIVGGGTRIAAACLAFTMLIAVLYHVNQGDPYTKIAFPASQLIVFVCLMITGGGRYSLDGYFYPTQR